jgi:hypothetical protein
MKKTNLLKWICLYCKTISKQFQALIFLYILIAVIARLLESIYVGYHRFHTNQLCIVMQIRKA